MIEVVGVRFKKKGKVYYFDPKGLDISAGQGVIVSTSRGVEFGDIVMGNTKVTEDKIVMPLKEVIRVATKDDYAHLAQNNQKEEEAFGIFNEKVKKHNLEMKLVDVEYTFDNNKILFYFTADGRVDFRELVKDLASVFRTRIELRQIGVRDEAKMIGGIGVCGRALCCSSFLNEFQPVSIKMAKEQSFSLNPSKISGICGRFMCCLRYEQEVYEELISKTPKIGTRVDTPDGTGVVCEVNLIKGELKVNLDDEQGVVPKIYLKNEISIINNDHGEKVNDEQAVTDNK